MHRLLPARNPVFSKNTNTGPYLYTSLPVAVRLELLPLIASLSCSGNNELHHN